LDFLDFLDFLNLFQKWRNKRMTSYLYSKPSV
jgi:hypothetical protein